MTIDHPGGKYGPLVDFVNDRLDEDEHGAALAIARYDATSQPPWRSAGEHIIANPRWARRDLAAKRRLVAQAAAQLRNGMMPAVVITWRQVLLALAACYADHPAYRPEWERP
jgi:hypothetical protein